MIGELEMITLEQYDQIRRMYYLEEQSGRHIAKALGVSRQTVTRALRSNQPPTYTLSQPRQAPRLGPYKARLDELLTENRRLPRKQRYTAVLATWVICLQNRHLQNDWTSPLSCRET